MIVRTVWYELLYGEWPFKGQPPETIVWQVSHGIKPSLSNLQASKDVKVCMTANHDYDDDDGDIHLCFSLLSDYPLSPPDPHSLFCWPAGASNGMLGFSASATTGVQ
jgi:hypothetical protein